MTITRTARRRTALTAALLLGTGLSVRSLTAQNAAPTGIMSRREDGAG